MSNAELPVDDSLGDPSPENEGSKQDEMEILKQKLESANKRISDTFQAYQNGQARIADMERDREALKPRPPLLDETEGLQEAIKFVTEAERNKPTKKDLWISQVSRAIPDAEELMNDEEFKAQAHAERIRLGDTAWEDPLTAIRALSILRADHIKDKAIKADREKYRVTEEKAGIMEIPGGSGKGGKGSDTADEAEKIRTMPTAEFAKMRNKVLGYPT